jgi:hypothetical protein
MAMGAISPVNQLLLLDFVYIVFERLYIIPITPMIPDTITGSGHGKPHDECDAHFLLGCMGIECN